MLGAGSAGRHEPRRIWNSEEDRAPKTRVPGGHEKATTAFLEGAQGARSHRRPVRPTIQQITAR